MYREPIVMGRKLGLKSTTCNKNKEINFQRTQNEEIRIQKNEEGLRKLWDNFKGSNIRIQ